MTDKQHVFSDAEVDKLQIAFGTFLQDYPNFWTEDAAFDAGRLMARLDCMVYGSGS